MFKFMADLDEGATFRSSFVSSDNWNFADASVNSRDADNFRFTVGHFEFRSRPISYNFDILTNALGLVANVRVDVRFASL